jgi:hypothetical protein
VAVVAIAAVSAAEVVVSDDSFQRSTPQPAANRHWIFVLGLAFGTAKGGGLRPRPAWFSLG